MTSRFDQSPPWSPRNMSRPTTNYGWAAYPQEYFSNIHPSSRHSLMYRIARYQPLDQDNRRSQGSTRIPSFSDHSYMQNYDDLPGFDGDRQYPRNLLQKIPRVISYDDVRSGAVPRNAAVKGHNLPLAKALKKLYREVSSSMEFYANILHEFEGDIKKVQKYCPKETIHILWICRMNGELCDDDGASGNFEERNDHQTGYRDSTQNKQQGEDRSNIREKFELRKGLIKHALYTASESSLQDFSGKRLAAAERLKEKVDMYMDHIMKLFSKAPKAREHFVALVDTLQELKDLINPSAVKNRGLVAGSSSDENELGTGEDGEVDGAVEGESGASWT